MRRLIACVGVQACLPEHYGYKTGRGLVKIDHRLKAEVLQLRWEDIDLPRRTLTVQAAYAKNGRTRTVPLNSVVRTALDQLKGRATGDVVFRHGSLGKAFRKACATAGIKGVTPHTLRHTFASRLVMSGANLRTVQELGGWQTIAMVERYSHLSREHKANAIERLAEFPYAMPTDQAERITLRRPTLS